MTACHKKKKKKKKKKCDQHICNFILLFRITCVMVILPKHGQIDTEVNIG